jgi:Na+/H+ antiporter NhaD/arsenite permease-like protein
MISSSANVVTSGIAERAGHRITFFDYLKQAAPITIINLIIFSVFLLLTH